MQSTQLLETLSSVKRLDSLLTEEFEALKNQNLEFFEALQAEKLKILEVLAGLDFIGEKLDQTATQELLNNPIWNEITSLLERCKRSHQRNELLISKQLDNEVGLTASAGISVNKFVAKVASDFNKPNGQKTVNPDEVEEFLEKLDVKKFYGVGKVTAEKMYQLGIFTGFDLKQKSLEFLEKHFSNSGRYYYQICRGIHKSQVKPNRTLKSVGAERTFFENLSSEVFLEEKIISIANELEKRLQKSKIAGKTITLKLKYSDFTLQTRSKTLPYFVADKNLIIDVAKELLYQERLKNSVRLLGLSLHNLNTESKKEKEPIQKSFSVQLQFDFR